MYNVVEDLFDRHGRYLELIPRDQIESLLLKLLEGAKRVARKEFPKSAGFSKLNSNPDTLHNAGEGEELENLIKNKME